MNEHYEFVNPPLPYDYAALEPFIDERTMILHHDRHLQTYVDNLNEALKPYPRLHNFSLESLIYNHASLPEQARIKIERNAGGVYNHIFFFEGMTASGQRKPLGRLSKLIDKYYGSFDEFKKKFKAEALAVFGSGYAWLTVNKMLRLDIVQTKNQMTPLTMNLFPILNIDVWEHAYYLKHYNMRSDYIDDFFNVINWEMCDERLNTYFI